MLRLLRTRDFSLLWTAGLISMMGDWALMAALPFEIYRRTGSTLATAGVLIAGIGPQIIFGSAAGVFVDRWDRRKLMVWTNVALALALLPLFAVDQLGLWVAYVVLVVMNVLEQLFNPAEVALLPQLVGPEHLVSANSLSSLNRNLARLVGPAIGGLAVAVGGLPLVIVVDLVSYLGGALFIALIGPGKSFRAANRELEQVDDVPSNVQPSGLARLAGEWRDGLRTAASHPVLRTLLAVALLTAFGEGILGALFAPWVSDVLHGDNSAYAIILSAQAIGGLTGAFLVGRFLGKVSAGVLMGVGALIFAAIDFAIFGYGVFLPVVWPALIGMVIVGVPATAIGVGYTTLQQTLVSDSHRGRVIGLLGTLMATGMVLGTLLAGFLGQTIGIVPLMLIDPLLYALAGVLILLATTRSQTATATGRAEPEPV
jgi:MFS family permease